MNRTFTKIFVISLLVSLSSNANAAKLYKWVDANGNISYQDQPPPKSGKILSEKEVTPSPDPKEDVISKPSLPEVVVYSVKNCEPCTQLVNVLNLNKIPHIERPLESDRAAQTKILERVSSISAPTIFLGEKIIQNVTGNQLIEELRTAGFTILNSSQPDTSNDTASDQDNTDN